MIKNGLNTAARNLSSRTKLEDCSSKKRGL